MIKCLIKMVGLSCFINILVSADELLLVHTIWRHGQRTPLYTFPNDPYKNYTWHDGLGELTVGGMEELFTLGTRLRQLYINDIPLLSQQFHSPELYIFSTDFNRTIMSAISKLNGMFSGMGVRGLDYPDINGWPSNYIPIPVHTIPQYLDKYLDFTAPCQRRLELIGLVIKTPEFNEFLATKQELFAKLTPLAGMPINFNTAALLADTLSAQKAIGLNLSDWEEEYYDDIMDLFNNELKYFFGAGLEPYQGVDFKKELPTINGGVLLWDIINLMKNKIVCAQTHQLSADIVSSQCDWVNKLKYFAYSAHDLTIAGLFSTFGFPEVDYDVAQMPQSSSCVTIELWMKKDNSTDIQVKYLRKNKPIINLTNSIFGCENGCSLEEFAKRSENYQPLPNLNQWCDNTLIPIYTTTDKGMKTPSNAASNRHDSINFICNFILFYLSMKFF